MQLDEGRLLLNGLQPLRRLRERSTFVSERPSKRQRTENLNSRYDRMIQTVNIMHPSQAITSRSQDRQRVASSSSTTTNDTPETLMDAYSHHGSSSLGQAFSTIKMNGTGPSAKGSDPFDPAAFRGTGGGHCRATKDLPSWLRGTISTLDTRDPLRLLLPDDVARHDDSSQSTIRSTLDIAIASEQEEAPFAFTSPTASSSGLAGRMGNTRALSTTTGFAKNDGLSTPNNVSGFGSITQKRRNDTAPLQVPFSTPGPASATSLLASPVLPRPSAFATPLVPTISARGIDGTLASGFVPFTNPGLFSSTGDTPCMSVATELLHPHEHVTSSPIEDATSPVPSLPKSPLPVLPFSTPGPNLPIKGTLSIALNPCYTRAPASESSRPYTLQSPGPHDQTQQESTPDLLYSSSPSTKQLNKPSPPSPRSSPAEHFLFFFQDDALDVARPLSLVTSDDQFEPFSGNIDYDSLDFQWKRFDRGDIVADFTLASSPPPPHPGSDETFWKQPAWRLPALTPSAGQQDDVRLSSSPASLRLSGVPTPFPASPHTPHEYFDTDKGTPNHQRDGKLFAWILPPRHAGPPSTPQSKTCSSRRTPDALAQQRLANQDYLPGPASEPESLQVVSEPQRQGPRSTGVSNVDARGAQALESRPSERRVPFAPCAGIYISPLQHNSENRNEGDLSRIREEESDSDQVGPHGANGVTPSEVLTSKSSMEVVHQRRPEVAPHRSIQHMLPTTTLHQDDQMGTPDSSGGDPHAATQTTIAVSTQSGGRPCDGEQEDISSEEDQLEDCSQETRDTIESWTA